MPSSKLPSGKLDVKLIEAQEIKGTEVGGVGKADPYGVIKLADLEQRSKICHDGGSKPVWNQTLTFDLTTSDPKYNELTISLFNLNSWRKDTPIGESRIDVASLVAEKGNSVPATWYHISLDGKRFGRIHVAFNFTPKSDRKPPAEAPANSSVANNGTPKSPKGEAESKQPTADAKPQGDAEAKPGKDVAEDEPPKTEAAAKPDEGEAAAKPQKDGAKDKPPKSGPEAKPYGGEAKPEPLKGDKAQSEPPKGEPKPKPPRGGAESEPPKGEPKPKPPRGGAESEPPKGEPKPKAPKGVAESEPPKGEPKPKAPKGGAESEPPKGEPKPKAPKGGAEYSTHGQEEYNSSEGSEERPPETGGHRSVTAYIFDASKDLGRKYGYFAVPVLLIAFALFAVGKRKERNVHTENSDSRVDRGITRQSGTPTSPWGMPTSSRQKELFYKIHGTNK